MARRDDEDTSTANRLPAPAPTSRPAGALAGALTSERASARGPRWPGLPAMALVLAYAAGCNAKAVQEVQDRRGQVNGETFEFLSDSKKRGEWNVRIRGNSMWVAHTKGTKTDEIGELRLAADEVEEIWELVAKLDFPESRAQDIPQDEPTVLYRHRVPGEATYTATLPRKRAVKNKDLKALVKVMAKIIKARTGRKARL